MTNAINYQTSTAPKTTQQQYHKNIRTKDTPPDKLSHQDPAGADSVTISQRSEISETYTRSTTTRPNTTGNGFDLLRALVANLLKEQGIDSKIASGSQEIDIAQMSPDEAQSLIADDGYLGVAQTSDRIANFAISLAGGDPSRLVEIKAGVQEGFDQAMDALGGWLPDISSQTLDAVIDKLDAWAAKAAAGAQA